ncbi:MAG: hypothetical protein KIT43_10180 [Bauldia sp.]|nr:hypothetical protein [Bauldia sp.]
MNDQFGFTRAVSYDAAGAIAFTSPGTHDFVVPNYAVAVVVTVRGAGGGGGGSGISSNNIGGTGGLSRFRATLAGYGSDLVANGGAGGAGNQAGGAGGTGGTASGGSSNATGAAGSAGTDTGDPGTGLAIGGAGGAGAASGGAGGAQVGPASSAFTGNSGTAAGGGGGGGLATGPGGGGGGGGGGAAARTFAFGELTPGAVVKVTVGTGGARSTGWRDGGLGARGEVSISWS